MLHAELAILPRKHQELVDASVQTLSTNTERTVTATSTIENFDTILTDKTFIELSGKDNAGIPTQQEVVADKVNDIATAGISYTPKSDDKKSLKGRVNMVNEAYSFFGLFKDLMLYIGRGIADISPGKSLAFTGLDLPFDIYGAYRATKGGYKSLQVGDQEGIRDAAFDSTYRALSLAGTGMAVTAGIMDLTSSPAVAGLGVAIGWVGTAALGVVSVIEAMNLERSWSTVQQLKKIVEEADKENDAEKIKLLLLSLKAKVMITKEELQAIQKKETDLKKIEEAVYRINKTKKREMKRRIGKDLYYELINNADSLINALQVPNEDVKKEALRSGIKLINSIKNHMLKQVVGHTVGLISASIGLVGLALLMFTPAAPFIAFGLATGISIGRVCYDRWFPEKYFNRYALSKQMPSVEEKTTEVAVNALKQQQKPSTIQRIYKKVKETATNNVVIKKIKALKNYFNKPSKVMV